MTCGSHDALSTYDDGHSFCFSCHLWSKGSYTISDVTEDNPEKKIIPIPREFFALTDRKIRKETAEKYRVTYRPNDSTDHVYPYYDSGGRHVANKLRQSGKKFVWQGESKQATLFGQQLFPPGSAKYITVVEGECDAMAAFEITGSRYPVVSVKSASSATKDCVQSFEYLNSFDEIVICFDKDEAKINPATGAVHYPGQEAALAVASLFTLGKVRVLTLREAKDANDYLQTGRGPQFIKEWWDAPYYKPSGLKLGQDMWDEISKPKKYETVPYPWDTLQKMTYGLRLSEFVLFTGDPGGGKTTILKEIAHPLVTKHNASVGFLFFEEPNADTTLSLMSITANKPLHLPDVRSGVPDDEFRGYYDNTVNNNRVVVWDHFGSNSIHEVLAKIRHMAALGCKYIVLDHISIIVSDQSGDERKQLDEISTKLKTLCMELNICVIAAIHLSRSGLIRGSAGPEQLANLVIKLFRDKNDLDAWRRNVTKLVIDKNRFCGRTGPSSYLWYNEFTGRLDELTKEEIEKYETGGTNVKAT